MQSRQFLTSQLLLNHNWPQCQNIFQQTQNCPLPTSPHFQGTLVTLHQRWKQLTYLKCQQPNCHKAVDTTFVTDRDKSPNFCQHYYSICVCLLFQTVLSPCVAYDNGISRHITDKACLSVHCSQITNTTVSYYTLYTQSHQNR